MKKKKANVQCNAKRKRKGMQHITMALRYEVFQDKKGEWRSRVKSPNSRILHSSAGDGYKEMRKAVHAINVIQGKILPIFVIHRSGAVERL